jgi:uncharacterized protein YggE
MKKGLLLVIGLVLAVSLLLVGCETQETTGANGSQQTGVWVSGTGKVTAVPDVAILTLGVEAQETTVKAAQSEASSAMNAVVDALKTNGVADKDIQTQWYNISPVMKWVEDTNEQIAIGYKVTNMATVKIRDISKAGATIDAVAEAGGNLTRINSINFTVDDPTVYYNQAREKAMQDANAKAEQMATLAGITLGKPTYISESGGYIPTPYYLKDYAEGGSASTPISPGELDITLTVQVGYAIE